MKKTYNNSFTVEIVEEGVNSVLRCYSYYTCILQRHYHDGILREDVTFCDLHYFSQTTRRHQGIARAIDAYFSAHEGNTSEIVNMVARSSSLRDLVRNFGYISINK